MILQYGYQQQYYPDDSDTEDVPEDSYAPEISQEGEEEGELENELPQIPREFSNLEELQVINFKLYIRKHFQNKINKRTMNLSFTLINVFVKFAC